jgi:hypothetical protein
MIKSKVFDDKIIVRYPQAKAEKKEIGIGFDKQFIRVGFSGPCSK